MSLQITSFQIISAVIVSLIGFVFRLGLSYEVKKKLPNFLETAFLFFFSVGMGFMSFLFVIEKENWTATLKLFTIAATSFFGSIIVSGLGSITPNFVAGLAKSWLKKWVNSNSNNNENNGYTDSEIQGNEAMPADEEDKSNLEQ